MKNEANTVSILYYVAEDFVKLPRLRKFHIGVDMKYIDIDEVDLTEEEIELRVFKGMYKTNSLSEFVNIVYKAKYDD